MLKNYLFVKYLTENQNIDLGLIKGHVVEISPPRKNETTRGSKEGAWLGFTKMPVDMALWKQLITGECIIDVDKTTLDSIAIIRQPDLQRVNATLMGSLNDKDWNKLSLAQMPGDEIIYIDYLRTYLSEITRLTNHIPIDSRLDLYPHAILFPCSTRIFIGRDGLAISYTSPNRPEKLML